MIIRRGRPAMQEGETCMIIMKGGQCRRLWGVPIKVEELGERHPHQGQGAEEELL